MLTRKNLRRGENPIFNSILSALLRLVLKFDFAIRRNSEGATVTHLTIAPSQSVTNPLPPHGSITLNSGASCVVRSLCGEVTNSDAPSLMRLLGTRVRLS